MVKVNRCNIHLTQSNLSSLHYIGFRQLDYLVRERKITVTTKQLQLDNLIDSIYSTEVETSLLVYLFCIQRWSGRDQVIDAYDYILNGENIIWGIPGRLAQHVVFNQTTHEEVNKKYFLLLTLTLVLDRAICQRTSMFLFFSTILNYR